jgi:hypothetical protein
MRCNPKCRYTASVDSRGQRLMISQGGDSKFPKDTLHPMCSECLEAQLGEAEMAVLFNNNRELIERWKNLKRS